RDDAPYNDPDPASGATTSQSRAAPQSAHAPTPAGDDETTNTDEP
ncbi:hypothetical protein HMPREF1317_1478, partial [Schaalia georgiae F0490]